MLALTMFIVHTSICKSMVSKSISCYLYIYIKTRQTFYSISKIRALLPFFSLLICVLVLWVLMDFKKTIVDRPKSPFLFCTYSNIYFLEIINQICNSLQMFSLH